VKRSSKQEGVQSINFILNGGLNWSQSRGNIADNEITRASNFIYDPATDYLVTRPGTTCQLKATHKLSTISIGYYYEISSTEAYHVVASGKKLYYLSGTDLDELTEIGTDLLTGTHAPSFLTFNTKLLIADGDAAGIKSWAGAITGTISTGITNSPHATALTVIKNRVVANHLTELDSVYLSTPNDETGWDTSTTAIGLKAGYGDNLAVNAFSVFGDDLMISKYGLREKRIYRLNVADATTANWYIKDLSRNNASQTAHTMISAWNNVYLVDTNGFKTLKGIDAYGDLEVDAIGRKINTVFTTGYTCNCIAYLPAYNAIWFNIGDRVYCYTERYDPAEGKMIPAFTDINFKWGRCTSMYQAGDYVYLTGYNGYVYKLDESVCTDESTPGVTESYSSVVRTKTLTFGVDGYLRKLQFYLKPKAPGAGNINVCIDENSKTSLKTFATINEGTYLFDATGYLYDATIYLYDTGTAPWVETSRNRFRSDEMAFELELSSGRCGVEWAKAEIALVGY
jgi:hypothetical protein